jgi:P4 family phage/plasmid primase-like protien
MLLKNIYLKGYEDLVLLKGKAPVQTAWQKYEATMEDSEEWADKNVGLLAARFPAIDCDVTDKDLSRRIYVIARDMFGAETPMRIGLMPKWLMPFRAGEKMTKRKLEFTTAAGEKHAVEVLATGQQYVIQGIHPDTKKPYKWAVPLVAVEELPELTKDRVTEFFAEVTEKLESCGCTITSDTTAADRVNVDPEQLYAPSLDTLRSAVEAIVNSPDVPREAYVSIGHAIKGATPAEHDAEGLDIFLEWALRGPSEDAERPTEFWNGIRRDNISNGWDLVRKAAALQGWNDAPAAVEQAQQEFEPVVEYDPDEAPEMPLTLGQAGEDSELNNYIVERTTDVLCTGNKDWFMWDGRRWLEDPREFAFDYLSKFLRNIQAALRVKYPQPDRTGAITMKSLGSTSKISSVFKQFGADMRMFKPREEMNDPVANCFVLCTPGGVHNLRSGICIPHSQKDYITQVTKVEPATSCAGDEQLLGYVQSVLGSALTADTSDRLIWFLTGESGSGKSTLLKHVHAILGDYAGVIPQGALIHGDAAAHTSAVAGFRDRRFLHGSEIDRGHKWNVGLLKSITGNEVITARRMYREYEEFNVVGKIIIAGNETPTLPNVDSAMKRRLRIIPFTAPDEPDIDLDAKIEAEYPAILAWMMEGARKWSEHGYPHCEVVSQTTSEYFVDEDIITQFRDATFLVTGSKDHFVTTKDLFALWEQYTTTQQRRDLGVTQASTLVKPIEASDDRINKARPRVDGVQLRGLSGLSLRVDVLELADLL